MRTSTLIVSALFGAGILAHPLNVNEKRQDTSDPVLVGSHREGNTVVNEYQTVEKVVVKPNGQQQAITENKKEEKPAAAPKAPAPKAPAPKAAAPKADAANKPQTQQKVTAPKENTAPKPQQKSVQQPQTQQKATTLAASSSSGTCAKKEQEGGSAADWASPPCSNNINWLTIINDMRKQWNPSLGAYKWSSKLSQGSWDTAQTAEQKGTVMVHKLGEYSYGQVIAQSLGPGSGTTAEVQSIAGQALKMWMCEIKKGPFCTTQTSGVGSDPQGHAKIFQNTDFSHIGCYFMWGNNNKASGRGMVTCDFGYE